MKEITIELSTQSITKAIKELKRFSKDINKKTDALMERLAIIGAAETSRTYANAIYDGDNKNDYSVSVNKAQNGYEVVAEGEVVPFLEFGAGVYHNPVEPYPIERPEGIVGIGEYGNGNGKRQLWAYPTAESDSYGRRRGYKLTRGNPATLGLYNASKEMESRVSEVAREVFR